MTRRAFNLTGNLTKYQQETDATFSRRPYYGPFVRFSERAELLSVYRDWVVTNKPLYAKYYNIIAMLFMAILIPLDFVLFEDGLYFTRLRVLSITLIGVVLVLLMRDQSTRKVPKKDVFDPLLLAPGILFNFVYAFFLYAVDGSPYRVVLIANFMVVFFTTFFAHRFWKEQYALNLFSIAFLLFIGTFRPEIMSDCILLAVCHLSSFIAAFFFRREFVASLYAYVRQRRR